MFMNAKPMSLMRWSPIVALLLAWGCDDDGTIQNGIFPDSGTTDGDGDAAELVRPIEREGGVYALEMTRGDDTLLFEAVADSAGLITTFALNGENILARDMSVANAEGSTFWLAPQSIWGWPPPEEIYTAPFSVAVDEATNTIEMTSQTVASLGVSVIKRFSPDLERFAVNLEYVIVDEGSTAALAPWEISRVRPGGLTFFPTGTGVEPETEMDALRISEAAGATWMDHTRDYEAGNYRYKADGARGWLAHTNGDLLFVKAFADEPFESRPDGQAEIQLYVNGGLYEEVEMMGAQETIPSGGETAWNVTWYLHPFPEGAAFELGNQPLVDYVDTLVK